MSSSRYSQTDPSSSQPTPSSSQPTPPSSQPTPPSSPSSSSSSALPCATCPPLPNQTTPPRITAEVYEQLPEVDSVRAVLTQVGRVPCLRDALMAGTATSVGAVFLAHLPAVLPPLYRPPPPLQPPPLVDRLRRARFNALSGAALSFCAAASVQWILCRHDHDRETAFRNRFNGLVIQRPYATLPPANTRDASSPPGRATASATSLPQAPAAASSSSASSRASSSVSPSTTTTTTTSASSSNNNSSLAR